MVHVSSLPFKQRGIRCRIVSFVKFVLTRESAAFPYDKFVYRVQYICYGFQVAMHSHFTSFS